MRRKKIELIFSFIISLFMLSAQAVQAQYLVVSAEQVRDRLTDGRKVMLIDARTPDEYREGHIPGAANIQPDQVKASVSKLPKDKNTPIIFYCRGVG